MAWHGVVTNAGAELIRSFTANNKLNIGSVQTGTGSVSTDAMRARTALVAQKAAKGQCGASIAKMEEVDGGIRLLFQVDSTTGAYICKEIGIWGGLGDDNSSTLIMYIAHDGNGVSIPDSSDLPDYSFLIAAVLGVSNVSNVVVNVDTTMNATRQYVNEEDAKKVDIDQGTENSGKVMMVGADGNVTPTEYPTMTGATSSAAGTKGAVPAPSIANRDKYLRGDGTWDTPFTHPTHTAQAGIPTANQTPAFGGTFNVGQVASDANGHVTGITNRTVKIPDTAASASNNGLMSATDFKKINPQEIPANSNLNDYMTTGWYACGMNATVATLANSPTGNAFFLEVLVRGTGQATQRLTTYPSNNFQVFMRNYYSVNGWGAWVDCKLTDTTSLPSMTGTLGAAHGGTGQTTLVNAANALINALEEGTSPATADDYAVVQYAGGSQNTYTRRKLSNVFAAIPAASSSANGLMSKTDKAKLDGIASGAKAGTVTSVGTGAGLTGGAITGSGTIKADLRSETKSAYAAPNPTDNSARIYPVRLDKDGKLAVVVPWTDNNTTYGTATQAANGLMSAGDKTKLDGIATGANAYSLPTASSSQKGGVKIGSGLSMSGETLSVSITPSVTTLTGYSTGGEQSYTINNTGDKIYIGEFSIQLGMNAEKIIGVHLTSQTAGLLVGEFTMTDGYARTIFVPYIAFLARPSSKQFNVSYL